MLNGNHKFGQVTLKSDYQRDREFLFTFYFINFIKYIAHFTTQEAMSYRDSRRVSLKNHIWYHDYLEKLKYYCAPYIDLKFYDDNFSFL